MLLKKALTKSGRRILKAIKNISTARLAKKQQQQEQEQLQRLRMQQLQWVNWCLQMRLQEPLLSTLDAKSIDSSLILESSKGLCYVPHCCCHCDEREENQRNENLENEMMK